MSKFIALPVGQGDAFYLERDDIRVLVDGGKSKRAISRWMATICQTDYLDVLVCTHNDADHANGVIGILDEWEGRIAEVWLPGSWTYRLKDLFSEPDKFLGQLTENIKNAFQGNSEASSASFGDIALRENISSSQLSETAEFGLDEIFDNSARLTREFNEIYLAYPACIPLFIYDEIWYQSSQFSIFWQALTAAKNIWSIVELAYHRGAKIRFFEFGTGIAGGYTRQLEPVNSQELIALRTKEIDVIDYLALSASNKESLVFYSLESETTSAVLFCADSDLKFSLPASPPSRTPIVTSPHHGAEANANSYTAVSNWLKKNISPIWVRSDCRSKSRPGSGFKNQQYKLCTLCNYGAQPKQTIKLHTHQRCWQVTSQTRWCTCK
ncbi:MAG: hypothetical protein Q8P24_03880 [Desulfobacterales bacterium]|nr:hypothetical protein [Desulfobacterales bacterium]